METEKQAFLLEICAISSGKEDSLIGVTRTLIKEGIVTAAKTGAKSYTITIQNYVISFVYSFTINSTMVKRVIEELKEEGFDVTLPTATTATISWP